MRFIAFCSAIVCALLIIPATKLALDGFNSSLVAVKSGPFDMLPLAPIFWHLFPLLALIAIFCASIIKAFRPEGPEGPKAPRPR